MPEAKITINDKPLSVAQAMTIRVAIESFAMDMELEATEGSENDKPSQQMDFAYLARIREIRGLIKD